MAEFKEVRIDRLIEGNQITTEIEREKNKYVDQS